jgi:hypothetical protein
VDARLNVRKLHEVDGGRIRSYKVVSSLSKKHTRPPATATKLDTNKLPHASTSYIGIRMAASNRVPWTVQQLLDMGFKVHPWDGR